jgi:hypothetical protein
VLQARCPAQVVRKGWYTRCTKDSDTGPLAAPTVHTLRLWGGKGLSEGPKARTLLAREPKNVGEGPPKVGVGRTLGRSPQGIPSQCWELQAPGPDSSTLKPWLTWAGRRAQCP